MYVIVIVIVHPGSRGDAPRQGPCERIERAPPTHCLEPEARHPGEDDIRYVRRARRQRNPMQPVLLPAPCHRHAKQAFAFTSLTFVNSAPLAKLTPSVLDHPFKPLQPHVNPYRPLHALTCPDARTLNRTGPHPAAAAAAASLSRRRLRLQLLQKRGSKQFFQIVVFSC